MAVSKKQQACVTKYTREHYDKILVTVYKGERDKIKRAAAAVNQSVNEYIRQAVADRMSAADANK